MVKLLGGSYPAPKRLLTQKTVEEVVFAAAPEPVKIEPIPFTMPRETHPIARFFSKDARRYAAGIMYMPGEMANLHAATDINWSSYEKRRPPNPDFFFELDIPYPVGEYDQNNAGMTYSWTPLGFMIQHDRRNTSSAFIQINRNGSERMRKQVWASFMCKGMMLNYDKQKRLLDHLCTVMVFTDPPADLIDTFMWEDDNAEINGIARGALVAAAEDFQARWNCGEWYRQGGRNDTRTALRILLDVA